MATRNERRRKAREREAQLRQAVADAFAIEEQSLSNRLARLEAEYPCLGKKYDALDRAGRVYDRRGVVVTTAGKRKFQARDAKEPETIKPTKGMAYGQRKKGYI